VTATHQSAMSRLVLEEAFSMGVVPRQTDQCSSGIEKPGSQMGRRV